jgi:hypothetical protein
VLEHDDGVLLHVLHAELGGLGGDLRVLADHQPANLKWLKMR